MNSPRPTPPLHAIPAWLRDYVIAASSDLAVDPGMLLFLTLGVFAGAIGRALDIRVKRGFVEPGSLWLLGLAPAGALKSPALRMAVEPLLLWDQTLSAAAAEDADYSDDQQFAQVTLSDSTYAGLTVALQASPHGICGVFDEGAALIHQLARTPEGRQNFLSLHNGARIVVNRKSATRRFVVERPGLSIIGVSTPAALSRALQADAKKSGADGLIDRFHLYKFPDNRRIWATPAIPPELLQAYEKHIIALCRLPADKPRIVELTPEGAAIFGEHHERHQPADAREFMRGVVGKHSGQTARVILNRAAMENPNVEHVSTQAVSDGIILADWLMANTETVRRIFLGRKADLSDRAARARAVIKRQDGLTTLSDFLAAKVPGCETAEMAKAAFAELESAGQAAWAERKTPAGRIKREFRLTDDQEPNPAP